MNKSTINSYNKINKTMSHHHSSPYVVNQEVQDKMQTTYKLFRKLDGYRSTVPLVSQIISFICSKVTDVTVQQNFFPNDHWINIIRLISYNLFLYGNAFMDEKGNILNNYDMYHNGQNWCRRKDNQDIIYNLKDKEPRVLHLYLQQYGKDFLGQWGNPPMLSCLKILDMYIKWEQYISDVLADKGFISKGFIFDKDLTGNTDKSTLENKITQSMQRLENKNSPVSFIVPSANAQWVPFKSSNPNELRVIELLDVISRQIAGCFNVDPVLLGLRPSHHVAGRTHTRDHFYHDFIRTFMKSIVSKIAMFTQSTMNLLDAVI